MEGASGLISDTFNEIQDTENSDHSLLPAISSMEISNKRRIFQVVDNLARGFVDSKSHEKIVSKPLEVRLPETEEWDFKVGDAVRVKGSRDEFKWLQKKTIGWSYLMHLFYDQVGFVTLVLDKCHNSIGVFFPGKVTSCDLYAGVLEKVSVPVYPNLTVKWKPGDFVTLLPDYEGLRTSEAQSYSNESTGRVVAISHPKIIVQFTERIGTLVDSAMLMPSDDKRPIHRGERTCGYGFTLGEKVKIISNVKRLIMNQEQIGNWKNGVCNVAGKQGTIIKIGKDGSLMVQVKHHFAYQLPPDSLLRNNQREPVEDDLEFLPGDIAKVITTQLTRNDLVNSNIALEFLETLRTPVTVKYVDKNFNYCVQLYSGESITIAKDCIRKASSDEKSHYESIQRRSKEIAVGDRVYLDVGPPNFVITVIPELNLEEKLRMALTESAVFEGYVTIFYAVIRYDDGTKFRVKREYLTVPEKFFAGQRENEITIEWLDQVHEQIKKCVAFIHSAEETSEKQWDVELAEFRLGNPPAMELRIISSTTTFGDIVDWLTKHTEWAVEILYEHQVIITCALNPSTRAMLVGFVFSDETS